MLRPDGLLVHLALWEKRTGVDVNRALYDEPRPVACWAEIARGCGEVRGQAILPAGVPVGPGDRLCVDGQRYTVKSVRAFPTHAEVELA